MGKVGYLKTASVNKKCSDVPNADILNWVKIDSPSEGIIFSWGLFQTLRVRGSYEIVPHSMFCRCTDFIGKSDTITYLIAPFVQQGIREQVYPFNGAQ